jgi:hypothetical protein
MENFRMDFVAVVFYTGVANAATWDAEKMDVPLESFLL